MADRTSPPAAAWRRSAPAAVRDLRGGLRLALEGVQRVIDEAEAAQQRLGTVQPSPLMGAAATRRRWPVAAWHGLRSSADLLGGGLDLALASVQASLLSPRLQREPEPPRPLRDALVAALNGVAGDHLQRTGNPLAVAMELRLHGPERPRLLVLAHDLGLGAPQWRRAGHDHGEALAQALDATPVYVHYNSGLAVADNGRELSAELERLVAGWRVPLGRIDLVGHGLGGLVLRSALHQAHDTASSWADRVRELVLLGTPLQGGTATTGPQAWTRGRSWPQALMQLSRRTSPGMADFAAGRYLPAAAGLVAVAAAPHPPLQHWHAIAGAVGDGHSDGWVPVASALGRDPNRADAPALALPADHGVVVHGVDHLGLLSSEVAFERMRSWLSDGVAAR